MAIETEEVYDAVRRGYSDLSNASDQEIIDYFDAIDPESLDGHVGNIKGILFEEEYVEQLQSEGVDAQLFDTVNHPMSDVMILDDGEIIEELQLKATQSHTYVEETLNEVGDEVAVVTTTEIAQEFQGEVIDSGISESVLEEVVSDAIIPVSGISILAALFGLWV